MNSQVYSKTRTTIYHLFNPRIEFLNEAKIYIKCASSAKIWSLYLRCLCAKGFPFVVVFAERGFPEVADWLKFSSR